MKFEPFIGETDEKLTILSIKLGVKVTKGQIWGGSLSKNNLYDTYKLCGKFHAFIQKCTKRS